MLVADATLRHRELTQEIFNIGDEVATYIENIMESVKDWDSELVEDCLSEFDEIIADAKRDSRVVLAELVGLRQALTSGLASGTVAVSIPPERSLKQPVMITAESLRERFPIMRQPIMVGELTQALDQRTELIISYLEHIVEWELSQTEHAARDLDSVNLPLLYSRVATAVRTAVGAWLEAVPDGHPVYARMMRGTNPPAFLNERARIDEIVARVRRNRRKSQGA